MGNFLSALTPEWNGSAELRSPRVWWVRCCCLLFLALPLGGCNRDNYLRLFGYDRAALLKKYTPQDDEILAIHYVDLLRQSQFEQIEDRLDPSIKNPETRDTLTGMSDTIPTGEPTSIKTVDSRVIYGRDSSTSCITLEYEFAPQAIPINGSAELSGVWLIAQVVIQTKGGVKSITGLHVSPSSRSFEEINEFTLANKGISQYAALCLAIGAAGFSVYAFVLCIRTRMGKKKWFWLVLILVGIFRFNVNWTTGEWSFTPLTVQVPPVMTACSLYGACTLQIMVPLGAIAFLLLRKNLRSRVASSPLQAPALGP